MLTLKHIVKATKAFWENQLNPRLVKDTEKSNEVFSWDDLILFSISLKVKE